jgi:hypothetical protein
MVCKRISVVVLPDLIRLYLGVVGKHMKSRVESYALLSCSFNHLIESLTKQYRKHVQSRWRALRVRQKMKTARRQTCHFASLELGLMLSPWQMCSISGVSQES